jgi:hypothetical protein
VLAYISIYINPATIAFPALFGLAYPYIAAMNVIMVIVWILFRNGMRCCLQLHLRQVGYIHNSSGSPTWEGEHHDLKLLSYNVRLFNNYESDEKNTHSRCFSF